ncbi:MAG TPA: DEAD/DEAH box helicase, partial [Chloroflexia bacterium]
RVAVYKVGGDSTDPLPPGVRSIDPFAGAGLLSADQPDSVLVLGGTPGGLYNLIRRQAGGTLDWTIKWFDLLVIDEASQMSLPEAVLAGAFLRADGQAIVVGDHRQMPPILAHTWKRERSRAALDYEPQRSLFESLKDINCPIVGLDESFRLHRVHAAFLAQHIYHADGIAFHSRRQDLLQILPGRVDPYVAAALDPAYPVIVIEHDEAASQQLNPVEIALAEPLIRACTEDLQLNARDGLGVVVPHRAQKAALGRAFPALATAQAIDTVERFQGGEREVILVSTTASEPGYLLTEAEFLFNRNRLNVAISRPRRKLIVLAARNVFRLLTDDPDLFEHILLWKFLRYQHTDTLLWEGTHAGAAVRVFGRHCGHPIPPLAPAIPLVTSIPQSTYTRRERRKEKW